MSGGGKRDLVRRIGAAGKVLRQWLENRPRVYRDTFHTSDGWPVFIQVRPTRGENSITRESVDELRKLIGSLSQDGLNLKKLSYVNGHWTLGHSGTGPRVTPQDPQQVA